MVSQYRTKRNVIFLLLAGLITFLAFNRHSRSGEFNYHSQIWADKAGYYVYLPGLFKYSFDVSKFPDDIVKRTGYGFSSDSSTGKIVTKYTCGVAIMHLPWYLLADLTAPLLGYSDDGFSAPYHWAIDLSSVSSLMFGLYFLLRILRFLNINQSGKGVIFFILAGTNLYYYTVADSGMSHVYSFFLFSLFLFCLFHSDFLSRGIVHEIFLIGIIAGCIVLTRPTNAIFLTTFFIPGIPNLSGIKTRLRNISRPRNFFPLVTGFILIILLQCLYWKNTTGSWIVYSYGNEHFNWTQPQIIQTLFAPKNGLFPYTPLFILIIASVFLMPRPERLYYFGIFAITTYVFASWWDPSFGCAMGARNYVEYLVLFSIPFANLFHRFSSYTKTVRISLIIFVLFSIVINLKITYTYDGCFLGNTWDWSTYKTLLTSPTK